MNDQGKVLVGVDVGGTFTDLAWSHGDQTGVLKVPSTRDQELGFLAAVDALQSRLGSAVAPRRLVHGTTVATNTVLEENWAPTVLITTEGFADVLEIGRQERPELYDLFAQRPTPIVPQGLRLEVPERIDCRGEVLRPLDEQAVRRLARKLPRHVESVAVVLLFSFLNDRHERAIRRILEEESVPLPITLSSELLPEVREYERTSTTVLSAALRPVVAGYLQRLLPKLRGRLGETALLLMSSSGGVLAAEEAARAPARLLFSGPAGGVEGARRVGQETGIPDMITLDMGGTSADVALIAHGELQLSPEQVIAGRPVRLPAVDVHTVGAGGGSIAWIDEGGGLRVGPRSAGAEPGPACYRRGGEEPTVTDAQLILGRLPPERALGGLPNLDVGAARAAVARVGEPLGLTLDQAAWGILEIVESTMEQAIRVISVRRGVDPRGFTLTAFGGTGPLHGATLARKLGMRRALYPAHGGALSALGLMGADLVLTYVRSVLLPWSKVGPQLLRQVLEEFRGRAADQLAAAAVQDGPLELQAAADIRYRGQGFELTVRLPPGKPSAATVDALAEEFHHAHELLYGFSAREEPLDLVSLRLTAVGASGKPPLPRVSVQGDLRQAALNDRPIFVDPAHGWSSCPVFDRRLLPAGAGLPAPSVVEGEESTCFIPPGTSAKTDHMGNLILEVA